MDGEMDVGKGLWARMQLGVLPCLHLQVHSSALRVSYVVTEALPGKWHLLPPQVHNIAPRVPRHTTGPSSAPRRTTSRSRACGQWRLSVQLELIPSHVQPFQSVWSVDLPLAQASSWSLSCHTFTSCPRVCLPMQVDPIRGNVAFSSAISGWSFTLRSFAQLYADVFDAEFDPRCGRGRVCMYVRRPPAAGRSR